MDSHQKHESNTIDSRNKDDFSQRHFDTSNAWVFISHSNKDFEKIIPFRNKLEALQYKPLLFFLKCLENDNEIFELIKREIQARDRFILCDSINSRNSEWVQKEVDFIKSLGRPYEIVDLEETEERIDESIRRFDQRSTMYIWSTDNIMAELVSKRFVQKAFKVCILPDSYFKEYFLFKTGSPDLVSKNFFEVVGNGYVLIILSRKLTDKEESYIESVVGYFKRFTKTCRLYITSKEAMDNGKLYYEIQNYDGIQPRIVFQGDMAERNDDECADIIVKDIADLDLFLCELRDKKEEYEHK